MSVATSLTSDQIAAELAKLPDILTGRLPDRHGIGAAFALRFAVAAFSRLTREFITKARGGTDGAGIKWKPLDPRYVAYQRRHGPGGAGKKKPTTPANAPSSALNASQRKSYWKHYRQALAWLAASIPLGEAKGRAAAIAWSKIKAEGATTLLAKFGGAKVEILRDTGVMVNSLSPALASSVTPSATVTGTGDQILEYRPGRLLIGTNVPYSQYHHGRDGDGPRPFWPPSNRLPQAWLDEWTRTAVKGFGEAIAKAAAQGAL